MCSLLIIPCNFPVFQYSGTWVFCASHVVCCAYQQALLQPCQLCRSFKFLHLGTASSDVSDHSSLHKVLSGRFCGLNCPDNSPHCFFSTHHEIESIVILITVINIVVIVMIIIFVLATEVSTSLKDWLMSSQNVSVVAGLDATSACAFLRKSFQLARSTVRLCSAVCDYSRTSNMFFCCRCGCCISMCFHHSKRFQLAPSTVRLQRNALQWHLKISLLLQVWVLHQHVLSSWKDFSWHLLLSDCSAIQHSGNSETLCFCRSGCCISVCLHLETVSIFDT